MSPVTQVAEVAVKSAVKKGAPLPSLVEIGRHNSNAPKSITDAKPTTIMRVGLKILNFFSLSA
jgi:hypothetical protein